MLAAILVVVAMLGDPAWFRPVAGLHIAGHVAASAMLTLGAATVWSVIDTRAPRVLVPAAIGAAATVLLEIAQTVVPHRTFQASDLVDGAVGVAAATALVATTAERPWRARFHSSLLVIGATVILTSLAWPSAADHTRSAVQPAPYAPDGPDDCPVRGDLVHGERIVIGTAAVFDGACLRNAAGGFVRIGPTTTPSLTSLSRLDSAAFADLGITDPSRLARLSVMVRTDRFDEQVGGITQATASRRPGVVAMIWADRTTPLLEIRTVGEDIEVRSSGIEGEPSTRLPAVLSPDEMHLIELRTDREAVHVVVNDVEIATLTTEPADGVAILGDMRLSIGNDPALTAPFQGTVEWVELQIGLAPGDGS